MKIAVDGFEIGKSFTGVGRYIYNLLREILNIDQTNEYTLFLKEEISSPFEAANLKTIVLDSNSSHTRWQNTKLIQALKNYSYDLFFSPNHSIPFFYRGKSLLTQHDASWITQKKDYSLKERLVRHFKSKYSFNKAQIIFTHSQFSKDELIKYYKINPNKISVIHCGVELSFKRSSDKEILEFKKKYQLGDSKVIGFLGSMFQRRHIKEILLAFKHLEGENFKLFLVGKDYSNGELKDIFNNKNIIYLERISEARINTFYSTLDLFLYLSDYEGFGFPPMEALSCGTPPLLLNTSSLKEIFQDMAFFIDHPDPEIICETILSALHNNQITKNLLEEFDKKAEYFTWSRAAKDYLKVFESFG